MPAKPKYESAERRLKGGVTEIRLRDNATGLSVACIPDRGFILSSIEVEHPAFGPVELLYRAKDVPERVEDGMDPVLFPVAGRVMSESGSGIYTWDDRKYDMPCHGFAMDLPWKVMSVKAGPGSAAVKARITHDSRTVKRYPFRFCFELEYRVRNGVIEVTPSVSSEGPFAVGFHPFFNAPLVARAGKKSGCTVKVPARTWWENSVLPTGRKLPVPEKMKLQTGMNLPPETMDTVFSDLAAGSDGRSTSVFADPSAGIKVELSADAKIFSETVVYCPKSKPYVCVENWTSPPNAINKGWEIFPAGTAIKTTLLIKPIVIPAKAGIQDSPPHVAP